MTQRKFFKLRLYFTATVAIAIWMLLAWYHFHGGVPSHHILANKDLPAISNWWGAILLPSLTWLLVYRIQKRAFLNDDGSAVTLNLQHSLYGFSGSLLFGIVLSVFFTLGYPEICGYMVLGLFLLALFVPIYRAEFLLGFVIGMTFTFGAILPTMVGAILALAGLVLHLYIRIGLLYAGTKIALLISLFKQKTNQ